MTEEEPELKTWYSHYDIWNYKKKLNCNGKILTFRGHSISAEKSGFYIQELKMFLDAGIQSPFSPEYIFITHGHTDHSFALPMLLKSIITVPDVYVPENTAFQYQNFISVTEQLNSDGDFQSSCNYMLHECCYSDINNIDTNNNTNNEIQLDNNIIVIAIKTYHSVPSNGYCFFEKRWKLKQEYLPPVMANQSIDQTTSESTTWKNNLIKLKKSFKDETEMKNSMYTSTLIPLFVYTGDTSIQVFEDKIFKQYQFPYIITECTYVHGIDKDMSLLDRAQRSGHIDFSHLLPIISNESFAATTFILTHFSSRYTLSDVSEFISKYELKNIIIWEN